MSLISLFITQVGSLELFQFLSASYSTSVQVLLDVCVQVSVSEAAIWILLAAQLHDIHISSILSCLFYHL